MTLDILQKVIESLDHKGDSATMVLHPCVVPVANQIQVEEPRAVYTHCYGHSLHLPCADAVTDCKITWNALGTLYEIIKLVLKSHLIMLLHFSDLRTSCQKTPLVFECFAQYGLSVHRLYRESLPTIASSKSFARSTWYCEGARDEELNPGCVNLHEIIWRILWNEFGQALVEANWQLAQGTTVL